MNKKISLAIATAALALAPAFFASSAYAADAPKQCTEYKDFTLAGSIYTGWMPWYLADENGVLKKWADKYCMHITFKPMDYGPSITDGYMAGNAQALVVTNIDLLTGPASAGKDTTVIVVGDFSNGNDKVLTRGVKLADLPGNSVYLLQKSVSQYVLDRALESVGKTQGDVHMLDTSDREIAQNFLGDKKQKVVVTWNPMAMQLEASRGVSKVFDSSQIPGEVQDLLVVDTKVLKANPDFGRALTGAWYEIMNMMNTRGPVATAANAEMAKLSAVSPVEFNGQLKTTAMFYTAESAFNFATGKENQERNEKVRQVTFANGLMDEKITSVDFIGISYPDGTVQGDKNYIMIRYTGDFMQEAMEGRLAK